MDYRKLNVDTWKTLDRNGNMASGYQGAWLAMEDKIESSLHIFIDETGRYHLAIENQAMDVNAVVDPSVNGLDLSIKSYRIDGRVKKFIDLKCTLNGALREFTEIVREIAVDVLDNRDTPINVVNRVIRNWKAFWANESKDVLSEEELIGLFCELQVFEKLCRINANNAVQSWRGPLAERHDFNFTEWNFEIKGTKSQSITINGIDQLSPEPGKNLALLVFKVSAGQHNTGQSVPELIQNIMSVLNTRTDLVAGFNGLLSTVGYSPVYAEFYSNFRIRVEQATFHIVNEGFPKITTDQLTVPLNNRITDVRYCIATQGLEGRDFNSIALGEYFY